MELSTVWTVCVWLAADESCAYLVECESDTLFFLPHVSARYDGFARIMCNL